MLRTLLPLLLGAGSLASACAHGARTQGMAAGDGATADDFDDDMVRGELVRPDSVFDPTERFADAEEEAPPPMAPEPVPEPSPTDEGTRTDAVDPSIRVILYTAELTLAVFEVEKSVAQVITLAREHGGYVSHQSDRTIEVRIPAEHFQTALASLEGVGDVLSRNLQARDVSEEYFDLATRIRTAEILLARLEALLERASDVKSALEVEREIRRLTQEIESMKGRLRYLSDRASYSTLTVIFQPLQREDIDQSELFDLPFPWLRQLGLDSLLELR